LDEAWRFLGSGSLKPLFGRIGNWLGKERGRVICIWFSFILILTPPIFGGGGWQVLANGDHSEGNLRGTEETFNPFAFAIVGAGIVVVGYFLYRIFSGSGRKEGDG